ncbi:MAG: hypothetical protein QOE32_6778 [Pseudonocardiales bacterium]|nr:hypothetical protein [Pseudonocardiales bacterium]
MTNPHPPREPHPEDQGYPEQGYPEQQGYAEQGHPEQPRHPDQQGYAEQGYPEQGYPEERRYPDQQGYAEHGYPEQGYAEHGYPEQGYAEQGYAERGPVRHAAAPTAAAAPDPRAAGILVPLLVGCLVAVLLGVYGSLHEPTGFSINIIGFSTGAYAKAWLATLAALLGVVQVLSARIMYSRHGAPAWISTLHRWSGRIAVLLTVPVVVHCLFALGFGTYSTRVLVHSLLGCVFYGAFVAKMLSLTRRGLPNWALPVFGGLVFTALIVVWLTSAVWLFGAKGLHT